MKWPISWSDVKDHIDDIEDGIDPKLLPEGGVGYTETVKKVIAPEAVLTMDNDMGGYIYQVTIGGELPECEPMVDGEYYIVTINGTPCKTLAKKINEACTVFGDLSLLDIEGLEGNGENFAGEFYGPGGYAILFTDGTTDPITISITQEVETIHPIDQKFLPGVCLPYVEITTQPSPDGAALTAEESAKMDEIDALGLPMVASFTLIEKKMTAVFGHSTDGFLFTLQGYDFLIANMDGTWVFMMLTAGA